MDLLVLTMNYRLCGNYILVLMLKRLPLVSTSGIVKMHHVLHLRCQIAGTAHESLHFRWCDRQSHYHLPSPCRHAALQLCCHRRLRIASASLGGARGRGLSGGNATCVAHQQHSPACFAESSFGRSDCSGCSNFPRVHWSTACRGGRGGDGRGWGQEVSEAQLYYMTGLKPTANTATIATAAVVFESVQGQSLRQLTGSFAGLPVATRPRAAAEDQMSRAATVGTAAASFGAALGCYL